MLATPIHRQNADISDKPTSHPIQLASIDEEHISTLISTFSTYLKAHSIRYDGHKNALDVSFTFWPYDYIDDDLDFDEFEYMKMCTHFKKWVETLLSQAAHDAPHTMVTLRESKMEFRDQPDVLVEETAFLFDPLENESAIKIQKQYWRKLT